MVASLLVLVFSITLAVTVALLVTDTVRASLAPATSCAPLQLDVPLTVDNVVYDSHSNVLTVTITRSLTGPSFGSLQFKTVSPSDSAEWICAHQCGTCILPEKGDSQTYTFTDVPSEISSISIAADGCTLLSRSLH